MHVHRPDITEVDYTVNQLLCIWLRVPVQTTVTTSPRFGTIIVPSPGIECFQLILNASKVVRCNLIYAALPATRICECSCVRCVVMLYVHVKELKHLRSLLSIFLLCFYTCFITNYKYLLVIPFNDAASS
jgi:hypothetical protein